MVIDFSEISIPHGHGLSIKKGICDGIMNDSKFKVSLPDGHNASYERGIEIGKTILDEVTK